MSASRPHDVNANLFSWKNLHLLKQEKSLTEALSQCQIEVPHVRLCEIVGGVDYVPRASQSPYVDIWDANHVKLPCSPMSMYTEDGHTVVRWDVIRRALSGSIDSAEAFENVILAYNKKYQPFWDVGSLSAALHKRPDFSPLLKKIADLALRLPDLVTHPIPLLKQNKEMSLSLSQLQIACLLANAFYCTFPQRTSTDSKSEYRNFPTINFISLFCTSTARTAGTLASPGRMEKGKASSIKVEKIICLLHYFSRVLGEDGPPTGVVTFSRRCLDKPPDFESSELLIGSVPFGTSSSCLIEDADGNNIHVDFANRFLGGGVLRWGCVQEEIMCVIKPEMLIGRLFLESLLPHEAVLVLGAERFSTYTGYSGSFKWTGDFREADHCESRDAEGRWKRVTTVIDAVRFTNPRVQFEKPFIQRELNKAYIGFTDIAAPYQRLPATVVSGHWGCGAYRGNKALKALIQLMACAQAGKALAYSTFGDHTFADDVQRIYSSLAASKCTVGQLWKIITCLDPPKMKENEKQSKHVFQSVLDQLVTKN